MAGNIMREDYPLSMVSNGLSKNRTITAKVSEKDLERINRIVDMLGVTKSMFIREAVMAVVEYFEEAGCTSPREDVQSSFKERLRRLCKK